MAKKRYSTFMLSDYTSESISIKSSVMESGKSEIHFHDCIEFELITGGRGYQKLNGVLHEISKGTITLLGQCDYHEVGAYEEGLNTYTLMFRTHFMADEFKHLFTAAHGYVLSLSEERYNLIYALFEAISAATECRVSDDIYEGLIGNILKTTVDKYDFKSEIKKYDGRLQDIIAYVNMHFRENPTIGDIAGMFHYNKNYICNLFEKNLGVTYVEYLTALKVKYAETLLKTTDFSVSRVCFECGFGSLSSFQRAFKKVKGITPSEIRKYR